jgi:hypothetical protein
MSTQLAASSSLALYTLYDIIIIWQENSTNHSQEDRDVSVSAMEGQIPIIVVIVLPGTQVFQGASTLYFIK